jgi:hypothetical protein
MKNPEWNSKLYKAHRSFSDFSDILWPEKFPEARLRRIRDELVAEGDAAGYSQEYLNDPRDNSEAYLRKDDFLPMKDEDYHSDKRMAVGVDFAISKADAANRTSFTIGGKDVTNILNVMDQRLGRLDSLEIIEQFFQIESRWRPDVFFVEDGVIWKSIAPMLNSEMRKRDVWLNIKAILPVKDKAARGRPLQKRMRSGGMRFDKRAAWYPEYEDELLRFTGMAEAMLDDQFDSSAILARGIEDLNPVEEEDFETEEEQYFSRQSARMRGGEGRSQVTGY